MAELTIVEYPDPILRQQAKAVEHFNGAVQVLATNLIDTLYSTSGIGLCAPQVGESIQMLVMDLSDEQKNPELFINPVITARAGFAIVDESCLSIPGVSAKVIRSGVISVRAQDTDSQVFEKEFEGMKAVCLQHEIDHLEGRLFIDRVSRLRRFRFRQTLHRLENNAAASILQTA
ncbi:MAG: peptide deformylase [Granulosicoccus sp.]